MAYVTQDELGRLRQLQREQDQRAHQVGIATLALFEQIRQTALDVARGRQDQKRAGEDALRAHGFDPDAEDLTIDLVSGQIMRLVAGAWQGTE